MALINILNPELKFLNETVFGSWPPKDIIGPVGSINQGPSYLLNVKETSGSPSG
jgi:hypothetical protein